MTNTGKSSLLKKLVIAFGGLFSLLVVAAIVVPLVVDVDKYRPMIVSKADEMLNGKLELGKLGLTSGDASDRHRRTQALRLQRPLRRRGEGREL